MRNGEIAAARARRLADAGKQFENEGVGQFRPAALGTRYDDRQCRRRGRRARGHVAAERIAVLTREFPYLMLGLGIDYRTVVQCPRGRCDRYPCEARKVFEPGFSFCNHLRYLMSS